ncbi:MAG: hypothetical protein J7K64_09200 [Bacteroidales bacterium]|nr:hypothetical protein [Bacteroidales bacterium]
MRRTNTEPLKDVIQRFLKIYGGDRRIRNRNPEIWEFYPAGFQNPQSIVLLNYSKPV